MPWFTGLISCLHAFSKAVRSTFTDCTYINVFSRLLLTGMGLNVFVLGVLLNKVRGILAVRLVLSVR